MYDGTVKVSKLKIMTTIQVRIDEETKSSVKRILDELGIDMSTAVKMYLKQIILKEGIPLDLVTENGLTLKQELEILKASEEAKAGINVVETDGWEESKVLLDSWKNRGKGKK